MVAAWKRPDVPLEMRKKFNGDRVRRLRDEIPLGHFQLVALQWSCLGRQLVSRPRREHQEVRLMPLPVQTVSRFFRSSVDSHDVRAMHRASRALSAIQQHSVEYFAGINHYG